MRRVAGRRTSGRVEPASTAVAFEVFGFLVGDENLEVVKVALAVVTPWSLQAVSVCASRAIWLTSSFWLRSGYLLRFFVMAAGGLDGVGDSGGGRDRGRERRWR